VWLTILVILGTVVIGGLLYGVIVYGIVNPHTPIAQTVGLNYVIAISTALMFLTLVVGAVTVIWRR
jgi:hypothetical protein